MSELQISFDSTAADVYSADLGVPRNGDNDAALYNFAIEADAEPDVFARIANHLMLSNRAPTSVTLSQHRGKLQIVVRLNQVDAVRAKMIAGKIGQLTNVYSVKMFEEPSAQRESHKQLPR